MEMLKMRTRILLKKDARIAKSDIVDLDEAEEILKEKAGIFHINYKTKTCDGCTEFLLTPKDFATKRIDYYSIHFKNGEVESNFKYNRAGLLEHLCELANCELWIKDKGKFFVHQLTTDEEI